MKKKLSEEERKEKRREYLRNWQREYRRNNREKHNATAKKSYHKCKVNYTEEYKQERNRRNIQWAKDHPEKMREYNRRHHVKHRDKRNEASKEYGRTHPDERRERNRKWTKENRELTRQLRREYVAKDPEKANRERQESKERKYGCKKTHCIICGYDDERALNWHHLIPKVKDGTDDSYNIIVVCANCHRKIHNPESECIGTCKRCGTKEAFLEIHHILPKAEGGADDEDNLVEICACCHRIAHAELRTESSDMVLDD